MDEWVSRAEMMERIQVGRLELDALLEAMSDHQLREPCCENGWSAKDVVAHITSWEQRLLGWMAAAARGEPVEVPAPGYTWDDMDLLNEQSYLEYREQSLESVLAGYRASLGLVFAALERLTDEDLNAPYLGESFGPLWRWFAENTYLHYADHAGQVRAWIEATGSHGQP